MDAWKTIVSFWGPAYSQGRTVSLREVKVNKVLFKKNIIRKPTRNFSKANRLKRISENPFFQPGSY